MSDKKRSDLLPCPFCGWGISFIASTSKRCVAVFCDNCLASASPNEEGEEAAIISWQARAVSDQRQEPIAWLHRKDPQRCTTTKALADSDPSMWMPVYSSPSFDQRQEVTDEMVIKVLKAAGRSEFYFDSVKAELQSIAKPVKVPDGWKFTVSDSDGRTWLRIDTPDGDSAALSCPTFNASGGETIASQVLHYLQDMLSATSAYNGKKEG